VSSVTALPRPILERKGQKKDKFNFTINYKNQQLELIIVLPEEAKTFKGWGGKLCALAYWRETV
jgi:hypothetical protein